VTTPEYDSASKIHAEVKTRLKNLALPTDSVAILYTIIPLLADQEIGPLTNLLNADEIQRASRFFFEKDRRLFIVSHALLQFGLAAIGGNHRWKFRSNSYGKPELAPPCGRPPLHFNLSHTDGLAACAFSRGHPLGIDVEKIDFRRDFRPLMKKVLSESEQRLLALSPAADCLPTFYRLWTLKEAIIKGIGRSALGSLPYFDFTIDPLSLAIAPRIGEDSANWQMQELAPTTDHCLALAVRRLPQTSIPIASLMTPLSSLVEAGLAVSATNSSKS
jgi:4'-phosphopantetheinyl transferase